MRGRGGHRQLATGNRERAKKKKKVRNAALNKRVYRCILYRCIMHIQIHFQKQTFLAYDGVARGDVKHTIIN